VNLEIYKTYADAEEILLHINEKFTIEKSKSYLVSQILVLNMPSLSIKMCW